MLPVQTKKMWVEKFNSPTVTSSVGEPERAGAAWSQNFWPDPEQIFEVSDPAPGYGSWLRLPATAPGYGSRLRLPATAPGYGSRLQLRVILK
jgi:hypothetical protein